MKTFLLIVLLLCPVVGLTQDSKLTNQDVIEMVRSGLPESVIITKIKNSAVDFETSSDALKNLVESKVPEHIISLMIEHSAKTSADMRRSEPDANGTPVVPTSPPKPLFVKGNARPFVPYSQLSKAERKARLKSPMTIEIAGPSSAVSNALIRAFQFNGYRLESDGSQSLRFAKDVKNFGAELLAGMVGNDNVQFLANASISENGGVSHVSVNIWISMENRFGKRTTSSLDKKEKTRLPFEDILASIKRDVESSIP